MLSRGILSGGIAGDPTIVIGVDGMGIEIFVTNNGLNAVSCDVICAIANFEVTLASGLSLPPSTPTKVSTSLTKFNIMAAYFDGLIAVGTYDAVFEAFFSGASVDTLTLPSVVTFTKPTAEGELSNANVKVV